MTRDTHTDIEEEAAGTDSKEATAFESPGAVLRRRREQRGLSATEVANELHLTRHYIQALEADDYDKLPGEVFVRGYMRGYASLLQLDPEYVLALQQRISESRQTRKSEASRRYTQSRNRDKNRPWIIVSGIAFVTLAFVLWYLDPRPVDDTPSPSTATAPEVTPAGTADEETAETPEMAREAEEEPAPVAQGDTPDDDSGVSRMDWNGGDVLLISVSGDTWVEVEDDNEENAYRNQLESGDSIEISGNAPFNILLGDATSVQLNFNGREVDISANVRSDNSARLTVGL